MLDHGPKHLCHGDPVLGQHDPRLQHIQGRRSRGRNTAGHAAEDGALGSGHVLAGPPPLPPPRLHGLPQRKLYNGKRHLPEDGDAPAPVQLPPHGAEPARRALRQDGGQRGPRRAAVQPCLRPLLDHLCRHADRARGHLAQARGHHVRDGVGHRRARPEEPLGRLVRAEEEGRAGRGPDHRRAYPAVYSGEAARGEEAGRRLEPGFQRVEREEREVDCRPGEGACQQGGLEGWRIGHYLFYFLLRCWNRRVKLVG